MGAKNPMNNYDDRGDEIVKSWQYPQQALRFLELDDPSEKSRGKESQCTTYIRYDAKRLLTFSK